MVLKWFVCESHLGMNIDTVQLFLGAGEQSVQLSGPFFGFRLKAILKYTSGDILIHSDTAMTRLISSLSSTLLLVLCSSAHCF